MATFPSIEPSYSSNRATTTRILRTDFGDGYSQRVGDGINITKDQWTVTFSNRDESVIDTIETFLIARGGHESFDWTAPRDSTAKKWICVEWNRGNVGQDIDTLTAVFEQVYDLD